MMSKSRIHLQNRDVVLLTELGEAALLDTETIHARHFPQDASMRACRRRLRLFRDHDLIQTIHINVARTDRIGRMSAIHRLTPDGAELLEAETGIQSLRTVRSDPPKPNTLLHRLGMAKVILTMNDACKLQHLPKPEWILEYDARPNLPPTAKLTERYVLCREFAVPNGGARRCWSDAACLLTIPHQGKAWRLVILWEYDRSTEGRGQLLEKVPGYESLLTSMAWRQLFPNAQAVRIFFVVPSRQRQTVVAETFRKTAITGFVRIAVASQLDPSTLLTSSIWASPNGESRALLASGPYQEARAT